jgi:hypothetical protein
VGIIATRATLQVWKEQTILQWEGFEYCSILKGGLDRLLTYTFNKERPALALATQIEYLIKEQS